MKLKVLKYPDPNLRKKSIPVETVTEELVQFSQDMLETMKSLRGIGLAAPQVDNPIRLIVVDVIPLFNHQGSEDLEEDIKSELAEARYDFQKQTELEQKLNQPLVLFNPQIVSAEGEITFEEGCLSVPGYTETVRRAKKIKVEALNIKGETISFDVDGVTAICIQHEIDHLDGKLFIDRLSMLKSQKIKTAIKKRGYPEA